MKESGMFYNGNHKTLSDESLESHYEYAALIMYYGYLHKKGKALNETAPLYNRLPLPHRHSLQNPLFS